MLADSKNAFPVSFGTNATVSPSTDFTSPDDSADSSAFASVSSLASVSAFASVYVLASVSAGASAGLEPHALKEATMEAASAIAISFFFINKILLFVMHLLHMIFVCNVLEPPSLF